MMAFLPGKCEKSNLAGRFWIGKFLQFVRLYSLFKGTFEDRPAKFEKPGKFSAFNRPGSTQGDAPQVAAQRSGQ